MYKLLVVDDEPRDRNIVRILVENQYPGQFEILEAKSGSQALEILKEQPVDLLILDLNMPGGSGMSVVRELPSACYVIILTAYDFFDYAREALHYGVKEYVLKPPIRSELYGAIDRFFRERQTRPESDSQSRRALARELAAQLLFYSNAQKIENYSSLLGLQGQNISLAVVMENDSCAQTLERIEGFLDGKGVRCTAESFQRGVAVLFFWKTEAERERIESLVRQLQETVMGQVRFQPSVPAYGDVPREFIRLCQEGMETSGLEGGDYGAAIETGVRQENFQAAMEAAAACIDCWDYQSQSNSAKFQLVSTLSKVTRNLFANADKRGGYARLSTLLGAADKEQLLNAAAEYLHWLIHEVQKSVYTKSYMVHRVIDMVKLDCAAAWTMESLSAELKISPYYLSHLFKEYVGSSFTDYLTEYRLERAVELMKDPSLSLSQIGEKVGYADQNYFSRIFKKKRGVNARQFRKQMLSE